MVRRSTLELFILSCFDRGLETPYDLWHRAGLSLGATTPALRRLVKAGMLKRSAGVTATKRPRHAYTLTPNGSHAARNGWKQFLDDPLPPRDIDSLLRILDLALHYRAAKGRIIAFLTRAITDRRNSIELMSVASAQSKGDPPVSYVRFRSEFESERLSSELMTLGQIVKRLKMKPKKSTGLYDGTLLDHVPR